MITPRGQESKQIVPPSKEDIRQLLATTESDPDFYVRLLFLGPIGGAGRGAASAPVAGHRFRGGEYQYHCNSG